MSNEKLKKELHALIDNTEDEELLNMVKEDIIAYQTESKKNLMTSLIYLPKTGRNWKSRLKNPH
ncbi:MAG: hypothetical protein IPO42_14975 [Chitinophagaceae bacterium]|nr:hypothetical protein [Chitinophagaceae bacterium]